MAKVIARVSGVALRPGVSKNRRWYSPEIISRAVSRAQERLAGGGEPMSMLTHHAAEDDSMRIVGRLTSVTLGPAGEALYTANIADTKHGRDLLELIDTQGNGEAFLEGVSIRGQWLGDVTRKTVNGQLADVGEDLELDGLDFTKSPGVDGARVNSVVRVGSGSPSESTDRHLIRESVEPVQVVREDTDEDMDEDDTEDADEDDTENAEEDDEAGKKGAKKAPAGPFADPGYQKDKVKRYPIGDKKSAKAAWSYINQAKNAADYTAPQIKRIKARITKALTKFGVAVNTKEGYLMEPATVLAEGMYCDCGRDSCGPGSGAVSLTLDNGMFTVSIYSYKVDPADLDVIGRAAMDAACDAVLAIDPDMDGDMDVPGAPGEDTDHGMESATSHLSPEAPAATPAAGDATESEAPAMAEPTTPAVAPAASPAVESAPAESAPSGIDVLSAKFDTLTDAISGLVSKLTPAAAPVESAPAADATEATPPVQETDEQRINRLVEAQVTAALQGHVERNGVQRKGLVETTTAASAAAAEADEFPAGWPRTDGGEPKPAHELTSEQWKTVRGVLPGMVLGQRRR
ncbi:MAG: hypothetical protein JWO67_3199 [Streptosporangiaceae bacterium]|nr:hypothetical protein [Streptosporangiaceae bacterium]